MAPILAPGHSGSGSREFGWKVGRRSTSSRPGRTYSNPAVVTTTHSIERLGLPEDGGVDAGVRLDAAPRALHVRGREVEGVAVHLLLAAEERDGSAEPATAHAADPAERALGDPPRVEGSRRGHAVARPPGAARERHRTTELGVARELGERLRAGSIRQSPPRPRMRRPRATSPPARSAAAAAPRRTCGAGPALVLLGSRALRRRRVVARGHVVGQGQLHDRAERLAVLPVQRTRRVGQVVLVAQRPHPLGDLRVAVARQVGEQVVLDLEARGCRT